MINHEEILRKRKELERSVDELEKIVKEVKHPKHLKITNGDGTEKNISTDRIGNGLTEEFLKKALATGICKLGEMNARIAKWE